MSNQLDERLVKVLGDRTAKALEKGLGLKTVGDLMRHYPRRYAERGELTNFASLNEGELVTVVADVLKVVVRPLRNRRGSMRTRLDTGTTRAICRTSNAFSGKATTDSS
jgi:ATP-dependent DNA helicase RecG